MFALVAAGSGKPIDFIKPKLGVRVARHPPIAAWGEADRADFGTVGQAGAFELRLKESLIEDAEPTLDLSGRVALIER